MVFVRCNEVSSTFVYQKLPKSYPGVMDTTKAQGDKLLKTNSGKLTLNFGRKLLNEGLLLAFRFANFPGFQL